MRSDEVDLVLMGKESSVRALGVLGDTVGVKLMMIGASIDLKVGGSLIESVDGEFDADGSLGKGSRH